MDMDKLQSRIKTLSRLLREYEQFINNWTKINLIITDKVVIEFYRYTIKPGYNGKPTAYRQNTLREFEFTEKGLDLVIDRYNKKIAYERGKVTAVDTK